MTIIVSILTFRSRKKLCSVQLRMKKFYNLGPRSRALYMCQKRCCFYPVAPVLFIISSKMHRNQITCTFNLFTSIIIVSDGFTRFCHKAKYMPIKRVLACTSYTFQNVAVNFKDGIEVHVL